MGGKEENDEDRGSADIVQQRLWGNVMRVVVWWLICLAHGKDVYGCGRAGNVDVSTRAARKKENFEAN